MLTFFKYLITFFIVLIIVSSYLLFTPSGKSYLYDYFSKVFSEKTDLHIKVHSIDIKDFPYVTSVMNVDKKAKLAVNGNIGLTTLDINYTFSSDIVCYENCTINDDLLIHGAVTGRYDTMYVTGSGEFLDGHVEYRTIKRTDMIEDLKIVGRDINSTKLFKLMDQETLINGEANVTINVAYMYKEHKKGDFSYHVHDNNFSGIPLDLYTKVEIEDMHHDIVMNITSPSLLFELYDAEYDQENKQAKGRYRLNIKEFSDLEPLIGYAYQGEFNATGEMVFDKHLSINGLSTNYGGELKYLFKKNGLTITLDDVSFKSFTTVFPYEPILDATTTGNIYYNFLQKSVIVNSTLKNSKFIPSKFEKNFYKKSYLKLTKESFNNSLFDAGYTDGSFTAEIKMGDKKKHAYLTRTIINTKRDTIQSFFDIKMQDKAYTGKVHGPYSDPIVDVDIKRAIEYQVAKKLDAIIGQENRQNASKALKTMPLGNEMKELVSETTASIVKKVLDF